MIISAFLYIVWISLLVVTSPLRLLGDVTSDSMLVSAVQSVSGYLNSLSQILPLSTLYAILAIEIAFETTHFLYKGIYWLIKRIPTQS